MAEPASQRRLTPHEYLVFERAAEMKHEYADGLAFAMSGGTFEHSLIAANILGELRSALSEGRCRPLTSDMRIKIPVTGRYVYPDGSVACGRPVFEDEVRDTLLNPTAVIEVLSDSSEAYDRGDKFAQYRTIPSLEHYVLASEKEPRLEHFRRQPDGSWRLWVAGAGGEIVLDSLGCTLRVDAVYATVLGRLDETTPTPTSGVPG